MMINIEKLKQEYGEEFARALELEIRCANELGQKWFLKINKGFMIDTVVLAAESYVTFYEVSRKQKKILKEITLTVNIVEEALEMVKGIHEEKKCTQSISC